MTTYFSYEFMYFIDNEIIIPLVSGAITSLLVLSLCLIGQNVIEYERLENK